MGILDNQGRLFGKFNIVDILIVLIIVGIIFGLLTKKQVVPLVKTGVKPVEIIVMVPSLRPDVAANIQEGDLIFSKEGAEVGNVKAVTLSPAKILTTIEDGSLKIVDDPTRYEVGIVIKGKGISSKNNIKLGNAEVRAGTEFIVRGIDFEVSSQIQKIKY